MKRSSSWIIISLKFNFILWKILSLEEFYLLILEIFYLRNEYDLNWIIKVRINIKSLYFVFNLVMLVMLNINRIFQGTVNHRNNYSRRLCLVITRDNVNSSSFIFHWQILRVIKFSFCCFCRKKKKLFREDCQSKQHCSIHLQIQISFSCY